MQTSDIQKLKLQLEKLNKELVIANSHLSFNKEPENDSVNNSHENGEDWVDPFTGLSTEELARNDKTENEVIKRLDDQIRKYIDGLSSRIAELKQEIKSQASESRVEIIMSESKNIPITSDLLEEEKVCVITAPYGAGKSGIAEALRNEDWVTLKSHLDISQGRKPRCFSLLEDKVRVISNETIKLKSEKDSSKEEEFYQIEFEKDGEKHKAYARKTIQNVGEVKKVEYVLDPRKDLLGEWIKSNINYYLVTDADESQYIFHDHEEFDELKNIYPGGFSSAMVQGSERLYLLHEIKEFHSKGIRVFLEVDLNVLSYFNGLFIENNTAFHVFSLEPHHTGWTDAGLIQRGELGTVLEDRRDSNKHFSQELAGALTKDVNELDNDLARTYRNLFENGQLTKLPIQERQFNRPGKDDPRNGQTFRTTFKGKYIRVPGITDHDKNHVDHILGVLDKGINGEDEKIYHIKYRDKYLHNIKERQLNILDKFTEQIEAKQQEEAHFRSQGQYNDNFENNSKMAWFELMAKSELSETYRQSILTQVFVWEGSRDPSKKAHLEYLRNVTEGKTLDQILKNESIPHFLKLQIGESSKGVMYKFSEKRKLKPFNREMSEFKRTHQN